MTSAEALDHAMALFQGQKWKELVDFAGQRLEAHTGENEIWKLYGIALASLGHEREARRAFLCALELDPKDAATAANYITTCLTSGDIKSAIDAAEVYLPVLTHELQIQVAQHFMHAAEHGALRESEIPEKLRTLLKKEDIARPYRSPEEASRALLKAASAGELADVERAWEDGADLDVRDREGWTALHLAIRQGHLSVADWLLQYGADPGVKGPSSTSPMELARQNPDPRFSRLLEGYFPKVQPLAAGPFATYGALINEIYQELTGLPARGVRSPGADHFEDLQVRGVAFGLTRAELATEVMPVLIDIFGLTPWEDRPEDFAELSSRAQGQVIVLTLEWIELPEVPLAGPMEESDRQFLGRYSRNIDAIARIRLVTPKRLERLMGALFYEDREEAVALGVVSPEILGELLGDEMEFLGWNRMKQAVANRTTGLTMLL